MALTPEIQAPQAGAIVAFRKTAPEVRVNQGNALTVYNIPTEQVRVTYSGENIVWNATAGSIRVTQAATLAVVKGRVDNPKLRAWWYTLDGHDYYVLKLGTTGKTLVFDLTTGQWSWWANGGSSNLRVSVGMNWRSSGNIPSNYGSNVVVGDDSFGILWVLDPEKGMDDAPSSEDELTFERVATGQMTSRDRNFVPIYSVDMTVSYGAPALEANFVTLEYSDDQGHTYIVADQPITVEEGNYDQEISWRSLGQVRAPGRLFRITDNGSFARIDSLDVNA